MQPIIHSPPAVQLYEPRFLGIWEDREIKILHYKGLDHKPYAVLNGQKQARRISSEQIYFGLRVQGEELVSIIKQIRWQIENRELPLARRCQAVIVEELGYTRKDVTPA